MTTTSQFQFVAATIVTTRAYLMTSIY